MNPYLPTGRAAALVAAAGALACGGDFPESELAAEAARLEAAAEGDAGAETVDTGGTLTLSGESLAGPGAYDLAANCSYSRGGGAFSLGMHPDGSAAAERGPQGFGLRAGWSPGSSVPLEAGTYQAEFEYREIVGDGTVPTYLGDAEMTIRVVDAAREAFPVVTVEATGRGEGVSFELTARCQTMVRG